MTATVPVERQMKVPLVDLRAHHRPLEEALMGAVRQVMEESSFIQGKHVARFEQEFAAFVGAKHCLATGNGTDSLFIALSALDIGPGDEVITVANSFIATSEAITATGARVVFVDCDPRTFTIDVAAVARAITPRTKAVIPVHLYGQPADMGPLMELAEKRGLKVIEDAAQAHGARYQGRSVGTLGHCACFSFYPGKNLGAAGDAGAVVTQDDVLATRMRMFANHGRKDKYDHEFEGINSRMDGIQGAILSIKLPHLNRWNDRRREVARRYDAAFADSCGTPACREGSHHVYHLYVIRVEGRDEVRAELQRRGVEAGIHYPIPLPMLGAYRYLNHQPSDFPVASGLKDQILSLPIHGEMRDEEVDYVIRHVREVLGRRRLSSAA